MPLFEYKCRACGKPFDELVNHPEDPVVCPFCKSSDAEKKLSVFAASVGSGSSASASATACGRPGCGSGFS